MVPAGLRDLLEIHDVVVAGIAGQTKRTEQSRLTSMLTTEWVVDEDAALLLRQWGDECVVYNSVSGDTHLLDALGGAAITCLLQAPATADDLAQRVAFQLEFETDEMFLGTIKTLLGDFERIGLIRQHPLQ